MTGAEVILRAVLIYCTTGSTVPYCSTGVMAVAIQLAYLVFTGNERATVDSLSPHGNSLLLSMIQASTVCDD